MARSGKPRTRRYLLALLILAIALVGVQLYRATLPLAKLTIGPVDLTQVADGQYEGEFKTALVGARVRVTVADHRITDIAIVEHNNGKGKPAEAITAAVVAGQSLSVDTVTGATHSSKVILKAIELALTGH
jgi:uncharacterized protein with FMN-binding domain